MELYHGNFQDLLGRILWIAPSCKILAPTIGFLLLYGLAPSQKGKLSMAMTIEQQERFETLVRQLEKDSRHHPTNYQIKVALLAILGYAYILFVFLLLLGIIWGARTFLVAASSEALTNQLNLMAILVSLGVLRLFWIDTKIPKGLPLDRLHAPELFATIDRLATILQAPKCDRVFLTDELNAGVLQSPRLGLLGWQQNYLFLGLPLMQALSLQQFRAVLAHELGHLSGNHSHFSNWIYRLRKIWFELAERFPEQENSGSFLFQWFFHWYAPYFHAYSFVLVRANEYEADRCGVELAGLKNEAQADINLAIYSYFLHKSFWPTIYQQAEQHAEPPSDAITQLLQQLKIGLSPREAAKWLDRALAHRTDYEDTHPCLLDRLTAIGYDLDQIQPPEPPTQTAAEYFFGKLLWSFADGLDREWKNEVAGSWEKLYLRAQQQRRNLAALDEKAQKRALTVEEMWKRACLTSTLQEAHKAIALFQQVLEVEPNHPLANYQLGKILIEKNDFQGIKYLEKAIATDPELVVPGCDLLYDFYQNQGKIKQSKFYQQKGQEYYCLWKRTQQERSRISHETPLFPHQLADGEVRQLSEQLSTYPEIKKTYLVRQKVTLFPEKAFYIFAIALQTVKGAEANRKSHEEIIDRLENELNFSGNFRVIILQNSNLKLEQAICKISGSCIYY
ncbi:MAG: M48 family metalloprotease [Hydrococcus sp. C42_A2020_068]|nr:M48 family metalloprotease [Hydrococcus sp. C42_A2020_068]